MFKCLNLERHRSLMKAFVGSQFGYCPLVWMFYSRSSNNRINHPYERALKIIYNDHSSAFGNLPVKYTLVSVHYRNISLLVMELYKAKNNLPSQIMFELLRKVNVIYNIGSQVN